MPYSSGTFSRVHDFTDDRDNGIRIQASRMDAEMDGIATGLSTALLKDGTQTATAKIPFAVGLSVIDNQTILLGTNSDIAIQYDETTNDSLEISANVEGAALGIVLKSDQGDDNADQHKLSIADGGTLTLGSKISGSFVSYLTHTPNSTVASSTLAVAGNLSVGGNLDVSGSFDMSDANITNIGSIALDTITNDGTDITLDSSGDIILDANGGDIIFKDDGTTIATHTNISGTSYRITVGPQDADFVVRGNDGGVGITALTIDMSALGAATFNDKITAVGTSVFTNLDISGDVDIDGTLEADAITVDGTALATVIAGTTVTTATNANHVSVADNESTNEENLIPFIEDASATGNVGLESDGDFAYNPSTGTVSATVFKGNIDAVDGDFDGTLEADAITLDGTAITATATLDTGISNNNVPKFTSGVADDDFLRVNGTAIEGRSASEVLSDIGGQAALTFGISDTNIPIFTSGVADDDFLRVNGTSIEGRSASEVLSDIGASAVAGSSSIVTTGALNSGSITSGFGTIDTGSSTITTTGAITGGSLVADNITIDGTEIDLSSGDLTIDVAGDIILDADDRDIKLQDDGTDWGLLQRDTSTTTSSFVVKATKNDSDLKLRGVDNNSEITALTLDMSEQGRAAFNSHVDMSGILIYSSLGSSGKAIQTTPSGNHSYNAGFFRNSSGTQVGGINVTSSGTAFETSSDYRLKENVNYSFDATTRLKQLKPARFNFIVDADTTVDGFIAHEVSSIVPEAITGEKDATEDIKDVVLNADGTVLADNISENKWTEGKATVDENGDAIDQIYADDTTWVASKTVPNYQGIDQAKLVPLLVKTIQELEARITTLESA
jgi:hypothetical protein